MTYWIGKHFGRIFIHLPFFVQKWLAEFLGLLVWLALSKKRKNNAQSNICVALGLSVVDARVIAKASVTRFGRMLATLFHYPQLSQEIVRKNVRFHGLEHLDQALSYNKGVVLASGHCGNWELLGSSLQLIGYPIVAVVRPQRNRGFDKLINEYRSMIVGGVILQKTNVRSIIRQLKENRIPFILIDQDAHEAGIFVKFFDRWASTATGAAALARMGGSPIVTTFITEAPDGTHDLFISPPLHIRRDGEKNQNIYDVMQQLTLKLEAHVRRHPDEWFWLQDRWRTKKADTPKV